MAMTVEELVDMAEHDALAALAPATYARVARLAGRGWSPPMIARLYAGVPGSYPALVRRVEAAAWWMQRSEAAEAGGVH
jgi:hypothetical protein